MSEDVSPPKLVGYLFEQINEVRGLITEEID